MDQQGWENSYTGYVRHKTGKPRARIGTRAFPWSPVITLVEAESKADDLTVPTADVLNIAVAQKPGLSATLNSAEISNAVKVSALLEVGQDHVLADCNCQN